MADMSEPRREESEAAERLRRLELLLEELENTKGPGTELALDALAAMADVYGAALEHVMAAVRGHASVREALYDDELVHHLLIVHGLHPQTLAERVEGALDSARPYIRSHGGEIELVSLEDGVARVRLSGTCQGCSASTATLERVVTDAILSAAPELEKVEAVSGMAPVAGTQIIPLTLTPVEAL